jgi:chromosome segregation ATPase
VTENTDGKPAAEQAGTATPAATEATPATSDTGADKGYQQRIDGLTAQMGRKDAKIGDLETRLAAMEEKTKSDFQKQVEEVAQTIHGEKLQRLEKLEGRLAEKRDARLANVPEEYRALVDDDASVEKQLEQIEAVEAIAAKAKTTPGNVDSGGNPVQGQGPDKRVYTREQFEAVAALAATDLEKYDEAWPIMKKAMQEGRVTGFGPTLV